MTDAHFSMYLERTCVTAYQAFPETIPPGRIPKGKKLVRNDINTALAAK